MPRVTPSRKSASSARSARTAALGEGALLGADAPSAAGAAAVNVFGGFLVTRRMLEMFKKKEPKAAAGGHK